MNSFGCADRRVCVIGAGIAGLAAARVLRDDGFDVLAFERLPAIGGVWAASRTYPGLRANNPRETYAFSDFPYPATADEYPTAAQVRDYLDRYVEQFHLRPLLRLGTEVCSVSRAASSGSDAPAFDVRLRSTTGSRRAARFRCNYVIVCNGVFSQPQVPAIDGRARFVGRVVHSSEVADPKLFEGKRVVVVGAGKSALDCACWAARHSASCTVICRAPHWMVPRYVFGRIRTDKLILTRFSELFHRYHSPSRLESFLHGPAKPLVKLWWRAQTRLLRDAVWRDGRFHLYRHILPPREPRLGFIGYASSVACQLTSEIAAHWLSQCFRGELSLPPVSQMEREIARVHVWAEEMFPARREGYFIGPFIAHYLDELMRDMGLKTFRTPDLVSEYFAPLWPARYRDVGEERRQRRSARAAPSPRSTVFRHRTKCPGRRGNVPWHGARTT